MIKCEHKFNIPGIGRCCQAYSRSKRPDGLYWGHYPFCTDENCPLKHPELLNGAVLGNEEPLLTKLNMQIKLYKKYSFEVARSIAQIAEEDGKFEDKKVTVTKVTVNDGSNYYKVEWKEGV